MATARQTKSFSISAAREAARQYNLSDSSDGPDFHNFFMIHKKIM